MKKKIIKDFGDGYYIEKCMESEVYFPYYELKKKRRLFWDELIVWSVDYSSVKEYHERIQINKQIYKNMDV